MQNEADGGAHRAQVSERASRLGDEFEDERGVDKVDGGKLERPRDVGRHGGSERKAADADGEVVRIEVDGDDAFGDGAIDVFESIAAGAADERDGGGANGRESGAKDFRESRSLGDGVEAHMAFVSLERNREPRMAIVIRQARREPRRRVLRVSPSRRLWRSFLWHR